VWANEAKMKTNKLVLGVCVLAAIAKVDMAFAWPWSSKKKNESRAQPVCEQQEPVDHAAIIEKWKKETAEQEAQLIAERKVTFTDDGHGMYTSTGSDGVVLAYGDRKDAGFEKELSERYRELIALQSNIIMYEQHLEQSEWGEFIEASIIERNCVIPMFTPNEAFFLCSQRCIDSVYNGDISAWKAALGEHVRLGVERYVMKRDLLSPVDIVDFDSRCRVDYAVDRALSYDDAWGNNVLPSRQTLFRELAVETKILRERKGPIYRLRVATHDDVERFRERASLRATVMNQRIKVLADARALFARMSGARSD
jgi:hypothetical protein